MGRHSNGTKNYRLAGWMWIAIVAIIAVVALIFGWNALRSSNDAESSQVTCTEGDYSLKVWAAEQRTEIAEKLAEEYNGSNPVVRDACVTAEVEQMADADALGAVKDKADVASVWIPDNAQDAAKGLTEAGVKTAGPDAPVVDGAAVFAMGSGSEVDEQASRAAADFASFAGEREGADVVPVASIEDGSFAPDANGSAGNGDAEGTEGDNAEGDENGRDGDGSDRDAEAGSRGERPMDVTFVLDTSGSMGLVEGSATRLDNIRGPLAESMQLIGRDGGKVGLYNYSSPISGAATLPFRANQDVAAGDDGSNASALLNQLTFGGATHTYESIIAAYSSAVTGAEQSDAKSFRVVLITDGPNDGGRNSLEDAVALIKELHAEKPVQLDVVTIGENVDADAMEQLAGATGGKVHNAADSTQFAIPLDQALQ